MACGMLGQFGFEYYTAGTEAGCLALSTDEKIVVHAYGDLATGIYYVKFTISNPNPQGFNDETEYARYTPDQLIRLLSKLKECRTVEDFRNIPEECFSNAWDE